MDIEEVGDNRHTTFFEMLGNWSLGDYFKQEQIPWFFEFLTEEIRLDPKNLYVTVFAGDEKNNIPRDDEAMGIWKKLFKGKGIEAKDVVIGAEINGYEKGMQGGRIFYYDAKKNWWSRSGVPENMPAGEPGGPDSEVFYDFGGLHNEKFGKHCHPNCDCGRFLEIGNSVFMEYLKNLDGTFSKLPQKNVDFGGGLERIAAVSQNEPDVFKAGYAEILKSVALLSDRAYEGHQRQFRIIADHLKAAVFLIATGVLPSNAEAGYVVRRLLRRAIRYADQLGVAVNSLHRLVVSITTQYAKIYPELQQEGRVIEEVIQKEERQFRATLGLGMRMFDKLKGKKISGPDAFKLFSTYGFPLELTTEVARERGLDVDEDSFRVEMKKHQDFSRARSEQKFRGGLADHSEMSVRYHTATHLLHQALRDVLGHGALQKGSNITPERLRFDFAYPRKMTDEEKRKVEDIVNARIAEALPVSYEDIPLEEAQKRGAIGLFEEKYADKVRVYKVGKYSLEFCGGPHVTNTAKLSVDGKRFRIEKEEAISAGVRRIRAVFA